MRSHVCFLSQYWFVSFEFVFVRSVRVLCRMYAVSTLIRPIAARHTRHSKVAHSMPSKVAHSAVMHRAK